MEDEESSQSALSAMSHLDPGRVPAVTSTDHQHESLVPKKKS